MKSKYFIYHIPGVKIGVSNNPDKRTFAQGFTEYEILEEHTNIKVVSQRERELQIQYGYKVDNILYWKTIRFQKKGANPESRKKAVANTDYKQVFESRKGKVNYPAIMAKIDWESRNNKFKKPVNQYDLEGNFIKRWDGAKDAAKSLNKKAGFDITNCCKGKNKTAYKYIWKYAG